MKCLSRAKTGPFGSHSVTIHGYQIRYHRGFSEKNCSRDTKVVFGREPQETGIVGPLRELLMCNLYRHFGFSTNTHAYLLKLHFYKPYLTLHRPRYSSGK